MKIIRKQYAIYEQGSCLVCIMQPNHQLPFHLGTGQAGPAAGRGQGSRRLRHLGHHDLHQHVRVQQAPLLRHYLGEYVDKTTKLLLGIAQGPFYFLICQALNTALKRHLNPTSQRKADLDPTEISQCEVKKTIIICLCHSNFYTSKFGSSS